MKLRYDTPFIHTEHFLDDHFVKTQASCDVNFLNGQKLTTSNLDANCGFLTTFNGSTRAVFCWDGIQNEPAPFNGLIVKGPSAEGQLSNCTTVPFACATSGSAYRCDISGGPFLDQCVLSLSCQEGTVLTTCPITAC